VNWRLLLRVASYFITFLVGFTFAKVIHARGVFTWDPRVNLVSLASLLFTIGVSVTFFAVFERQKYSDKLRKDGLLERLKVCRSSLMNLEEMCEETTLDYDRIVRIIKKFRREFRVFMQFAEAAKSPLIEKDRKGFNAIAGEIHELLTGTPRRQNPEVAPANLPLRKEGTNLMISSERQIEVAAKIDKVKRCLDGIETGIILRI
jgi:hypothetical protein